MLIILSPSKTLDFKSNAITARWSDAEFLNDAQVLMTELLKLSVDDIADFMKISPALALSNFNRFREWHVPFTTQNAKQAIMAFRGDVYQGLDADTFTDDDFTVAQNSLRILSGLYGLLKPLDLIQAYRLEMGRKLKTPDAADLYKFWSDKITRKINTEMQQNNHKELINLASEEYFKVIDKKKIERPIITPVFKEDKNGRLQVVGIHAKKARGLMARFAIKNSLTIAHDLKAFDEAGYIFRENLSSDTEWIFTRLSF